MKENVLGIIGSLARQQEDFNRTMRQLTAAPEREIVEHEAVLPAPALTPSPQPAALPARVESAHVEPVAPISASPKAPPSTEKPSPEKPENDELAEQIMAELERVESKGMTPRDLGKKVQAQVPGKPSVPPHQRYRFRTVMQKLVTEQRIARLDADDPKKLRYVTANFAPASQ